MQSYAFFTKFAVKYNPYMTDILPTDPAMLLSYVNMKLRDEYATLDELCAALDADRSELEQRLAAAGFEYSPENNRFW